MCQAKPCRMEVFLSAMSHHMCSCQSCCYQPADSFQTVWYYTQLTLCIIALLNNRNHCALISHLYFMQFLLIVLFITVSASFLSRGRAMEAEPSNAVFFFFTQPASIVLFYANPSATPTPSVLPPITTEAQKLEVSLFLVVPFSLNGVCAFWVL